MLGFVATNLLLKKKKKEKFSEYGEYVELKSGDGAKEPTENNKKKEERYEIISYIVNLLLFIGAMVLFFQCVKLKDPENSIKWENFKVLEFLAAFFCAPCYIIYRLVFNPKEHCIGEEEKLARMLKNIQNNQSKARQLNDESEV